MNQGLKLFGEGRYDEALPLLRQAAQSGFALAQVDLGLMYEGGVGGLAKDGVQAVYWYRKATEKDFEAAQYRLGLMYENGRGGLTKRACKVVG